MLEEESTISVEEAITRSIKEVTDSDELMTGLRLSDQLKLVGVDPLRFNVFQLS